MVQPVRTPPEPFPHRPAKPARRRSQAPPKNRQQDTRHVQARVSGLTYLSATTLVPTAAGTRGRTGFVLGCRTGLIQASFGALYGTCGQLFAELNS